MTQQEFDWNTSTPEGFSSVKGDENYWLLAVKDFWHEMEMDTDEIELRVIINWFDAKRKQLQANS